MIRWRSLRIKVTLATANSKVIIAIRNLSNRHNLSAEEAVKLSNTDLYNLSQGVGIDKENLNEKYKSKA